MDQNWDPSAGPIPPKVRFRRSIFRTFADIAGRRTARPRRRPSAVRAAPSVHRPLPASGHIRTIPIKKTPLYSDLGEYRGVLNRKILLPPKMPFFDVSEESEILDFFHQIFFSR